MWELQETDDYERRRRSYEKNHPAELERTLDNLDTYVTALRQGANPLQIKFGFVHSEGQGVLAIDQRGGGGGKKLKQTRLYIFPDVATKTVHEITLGDKATQRADIAVCREFMRQLKKEMQDGKKTIQQRGPANEPDVGIRSVREERGAKDFAATNRQAPDGVTGDEVPVTERHRQEDGMLPEPDIETRKWSGRGSAPR